MNLEFEALSWEGKYAQAPRPERRAEELPKEVPAEHRPDYTNSLNNLASLFRSQGDWATGLVDIGAGTMTAEPMKTGCHVVKSE